MVREQVKALAVKIRPPPLKHSETHSLIHMRWVLAINIVRTSGEMFAGFRGWGETEKPQVEKLVLDVKWFIFARFWLDKASSVLLRFATQSVWTGMAQDYYISFSLDFEYLNNRIAISWTLFIHLHYFISKLDEFLQYPCIFQDGSSESVIKLKE